MSQLVLNCFARKSNFRFWRKFIGSTNVKVVKKYDVKKELLYNLDEVFFFWRENVTSY